MPSAASPPSLRRHPASPLSARGSCLPPPPTVPPPTQPTCPRLPRGRGSRARSHPHARARAPPLVIPVSLPSPPLPLPRAGRGRAVQAAAETAAANTSGVAAVRCGKYKAHWCGTARLPPRARERGAPRRGRRSALPPTPTHTHTRASSKERGQQEPGPSKAWRHGKGTGVLGAPSLKAAWQEHRCPWVLGAPLGPRTRAPKTTCSKTTLPSTQAKP